MLEWTKAMCLGSTVVCCGQVATENSHSGTDIICGVGMHVLAIDGIATVLRACCSS